MESVNDPFVAIMCSTPPVALLEHGWLENNLSFICVWVILPSGCGLSYRRSGLICSIFMVYENPSLGKCHCYTEGGDRIGAKLTPATLVRPSICTGSFSSVGLLLYPDDGRSGSFLQNVGNAADIPRNFWHQSRKTVIIEHWITPEVILE